MTWKAVFGVALIGLAAGLSIGSLPHAFMGSASACDAPSNLSGHFVEIPGGSFVKGAAPLYPEERPTRRVIVAPFQMLAHEVTNAQFGAFVDATGYVTDAERERVGAGSATFVGGETPHIRASWWRLTRGATWRAPEGPGSTIDGRDRYPVIHVSLNDARAYAAWAGGRVPNAVEWEYAASLGLPDPRRQESGAFGPDGEPRANIWNGPFPIVDTGEDGHAGLAPVGCFSASRLGLHDMIGNVWEWTETRLGPDFTRYAIKGGSYLCSDAYCRRYRPAAVEAQDVDFSTAHLGFRIVKDPPPRT